MSTPPPFTDTALLAADAQGRQVVSIHAKRTYQLLPNGRCIRAEKQMPFLTVDPEAEDAQPDETDVTPIKTGTDLIVMASAHAPRSGVREMVASIEVGTARWEFAVSGDRRCACGADRRIIFSPPEPFESIPLRYENAYGGIDESVPNPAIETALDAFTIHPGIYPRNPVGRGYVVYENPEVIEGLLLPNVEFPVQRLTPETLVARGPENWWRRPLAWSCDWFDKTWYPRITYYGGLPPHLPDDDSTVPEVHWGLVAPGQNARHAALPLEEAIDARFANAASPALVLPYLRGDEAVLLQGMTPQGRIIVQLPGERPRMHVRFEGQLHEVFPVPHRVLISTEEMGVYVVWAGVWPTPRRLPLRFPRQGEDSRMELEGVDVFTDAQWVPPLA